jgi:signal transduction protein with GAF and PtsI domain
MGVSHFMKQEVTRLREENEELKEEVYALRRYIDSINALVDAVDDLDPASPIMPLLERTLFNAQLVVNATEGSLLILDEETGDLVFVLSKGTMADRLQGRRMPHDKGIAGWVVHNAKPTIVNNAPADDRFYAGIDEALQFQTRSVVAAPIIGRSRMLGVIELLNKRDGEPFNEMDQSLLMLLCRLAGDVLYAMMDQEEAGHVTNSPTGPTTDEAPSE